MSIDLLLSRLDGVHQVGDHSRARCPSCGGRNNTKLSIKDAGDGRILVHDFGGCSVDEVVSAVGMELSDLMPPRPRDTETGPGGSPPLRQPLPPVRDLLRVAAHEALIVALAMESEWRGDDVPLEDWDRVLLAVQRLRVFAEQAGVS